MYPDSRQTVYMGINFVLLPMPIIDPHHYLQFQGALMEEGIDFTKAAIRKRQIVIVREESPPLQLRVSASEQAPTGQLLVLAPEHGCSLELFIRETEAIVRAVESAWPTQQKQTVRSDVTFRDLYETTAPHAFQELWEMRLGQRAESLAVWGRAVLGGGLRFVMPAQPGDPSAVQIEVKIESYLRDTRKIFVETQFLWPTPSQAGERLDPARRLRQVDAFIETEVTRFLTGEVAGGD